MFDQVRGLYSSLQRPNIEDHPVLVKWLEDPYLATTVFDDANFVGDAAEQAKFWIETNAEVYGANEITLISRRLKDGAPLGLLLLKNIDWRSRTADMHYLIGDAEHRTGIYGPELALLSLMWVFNTLNFHKIYGYVLSSNLSSRSLASFGGIEEGVLRQYLRGPDGWLDYHLYSLRAPEFREFLSANRSGVLRKHDRLGLIPDC